MSPFQAAIVLAALFADPLESGDHRRTLSVDGRERSYLVHVPPQYQSGEPTPVVLVLHGATINAPIMAALSAMSRKSDEAGFIVVYPNGTGDEPVLYWNAGQLTARIVREKPDDVKFISRVLDDLETVVTVDRRRVYASGMSNGGAMCYRLASELSDRIAAIAPVAGTMAIAKAHPKRPVPVIAFHGTDDSIVKYNGGNTGALQPHKSVDETAEIWRKLNGCPEAATVTDLPDQDLKDGCTVRRKQFPPGKANAEVVLYRIQNGGHTWPGQKSPLPVLGKSTLDISANDLIWEFFQKHPMPGE